MFTLPFLPRAGLTAQSSQQLALPKYAASPHKFQTPPEWNVTTFTGQTPYTARQGLSSLLRVLPLSASCLAVATGSHSLPPTQVTKFLFSFLTSVMPSAEGPPFKDLQLASPEVTRSLSMNSSVLLRTPRQSWSVQSCHRDPCDSIDQFLSCVLPTGSDHSSHKTNITSTKRDCRLFLRAWDIS